MADSGIQQTQKVVNFRNGSDRGTRVSAGCFLVNGDCGGEAVNGIDIGFVDIIKNCLAYADRLST